MNKAFDITVFGATGLTGKNIVKHIYELSLNKPEFYKAANAPDNSGASFRWAIAGRNKHGLEQVIEEMEQLFPNASVSRPSILIVNVTQREQLNDMTRQTKVLINAVGPFRFMGEYVVRACVENGCHYVDVTGEPEFVERMQRTYQDKAKANKVTIVHSCGFDSNAKLIQTSIWLFSCTQVPTDIGVLYTKSLYTKHGWKPNQIEMFLKIHTGPAGLRGGFATFESAVHGFGSAKLLKEIRKASVMKPLPHPDGQKLVFHKGVHYDKEFGYHVPFFFADPSIVRLSQQIFYNNLAFTDSHKSQNAVPPPVQFAAYLLLPSLWAVILFTVFGYIFSFLASRPWGRNLLLKNPEFFSYGIFSRNHPTKNQLEQTSFEIILRSKGYDHSLTPKYNVPPNRSFKVVVRGPELGYVATPRIVLQCALTILYNQKSENTIPNGVLTPATAFWQTDLIDRLRQVGITYDISI
ncbi:saccharopine dehydrogenase [Mycotypha africana]|uniref:saccharopine dehydrogenase n=1 Tax=Mycotypha africana TaxID=64632 RepID=UPI00230128EC|nr:saccharopine dehydrogenase [Mycotypha africana]KAI8987703.1 saccharopine dehydrogenase [Mycotypha africana]